MSWCDGPFDTCLHSNPVTRLSSTSDNFNIFQDKTVNTILKIPNTDIEIPLRTRQRKFQLITSDSYLRSGYVVITPTDDIVDCFSGNTRGYGFTVSENAFFIDSTVFILDTFNKNVFWREDNYSCVFSGSSSDMAGFHHPTWSAHKIRFNDVHITIHSVWKLMINGIVEILYEGTAVKYVYTDTSPLIIVWPVPDQGTPFDTDILQYGFYDYMADNEGSGTSPLIQADGGMDFYYPYWLRQMGTHREEDAADAAQRYIDVWGSITNLKAPEKRTISKPIIHGASETRGSIVRDGKGNTFASVKVDVSEGINLYFNRLVDKDNKPLTLTDPNLGSNIRYYPIGLL